jgi:hypothetical protein
LVSETVLAIATTSLVVELIAFGLLTLGYFQKRIRNYRQHGITMTVAVVLHLVVIFSWMIASLVIFLRAAPLDLGNILEDAALAHVALGMVAASLGVWLIGIWHLQADVQKCFGRKRLMLTTLILWSVAVLLGIFLYYVVIMS